MKPFSFFDILNTRKPVSHLAFFIISIVITVLIKLSGKYPELPAFSFGLFFMLFLQLEAFIFLGTKLFADLNFNKRPGEITRIVFVRLVFFLSACLVISLILFILLQYVLQLVNGVSFSQVVSDFIHKGVRNWFNSTIKGLSFGAIIFIVLLWQSSLYREQKLREENLIFQNETLKNQVNPHFLFNSLNTLSSLISTQPEIADEFIGRLSSIYRYILENSTKDKVPLQSELTFINDYFFLHKIRDDNKIRMEINIQDPDKYLILPVSLQILVENAIKHNIATRENPLKISIYAEGDYISVKNNLQKMSARLSSTGIGLKNLAERTKLITGKLLQIEETKSDYIVKLPLIQ
jgi:sensor histidine kinase YesM